MCDKDNVSVGVIEYKYFNYGAMQVVTIKKLIYILSQDIEKTTNILMFIQ